MNGSFETLKELLTLHSPVLRRAILVLVPFFAVSLIVVAPFVEAFSQDLGFKVAIAALLFFIGVLVEHVAANVSRLEDMTTTVKTLDTGIQQIKSSVGVQEGLEVHEKDSMASRRQLEIIDGRQPERVKLCEYSSGAVKGQLEHLAVAETTESVSGGRKTR